MYKSFPENKAPHHQVGYLKSLIKKNKVHKIECEETKNYDIQLPENPTKVNHEKIAKNSWNTMSPREWMRENNVMSFLDLSTADFIEDAKTGEIHELFGLQKEDHIKMIKREREKLLNTRKKLGLIDPNISSYIYFKMWIPVCEINGLRAAPIWNKQRVIKGDNQLFILNAMRESRSISPTKLIAKYKDEMWEVSDSEARKILKKPLENLLEKGIIKLVEGNGFRSYKYDDVTIEKNVFLRNK